MRIMKECRAFGLTLLSLVTLATVGACGGADTASVTDPGKISANCPGINLGPTPAQLTLSQHTPPALAALGNGLDTARYQAEIAVRGTIAYTSTWAGAYRHPNVPGNTVNVWDVSGNTPVLLDSVIVAGAITTGDVEVSDDGQLLVVATEYYTGSMAVYSLADPRHPRLISRYSSDQTAPGVHTAKLGRVNGKLYAFLAVDPSGDSNPARLVIVDLSVPESPVPVFTKITGTPYVHDTYQRDGLLFVALWNAGVDIWDIGGCGSGASPEHPVVLGNVQTVGGAAHNIWWYHDPSGSKRFAFVGEEAPGTVPSNSRGDIHVIDVSDLAAPKEVAFYSVPGAGTHNFSVDEVNGVLYAAYYNAGLRAIDIRGNLGSCPRSQQAFNAAANLYRCDLRLMGRELATGLTDVNKHVYVWGVKYLNDSLYASDMLNGIWKLGVAK
ncbi:MAG: hypothetical protein ABI205_06005 [Gemmatimonadaceae bacterium]